MLPIPMLACSLWRGERVSKLALVLLLPCLGLGVWFFVARNSSYSWFLQDGMRLAFGPDIRSEPVCEPQVMMRTLTIFNVFSHFAD